MKVRPVEESTHHYFRNLMRAYLEGKKDLRWLKAMIGHQLQHAARAAQFFNEIHTPTDRRVFQQQSFDACLA